MTYTLSRIGHSGLFDSGFYLRRNPDLHPLGSGVLAQYHQHGWREGRKPNAFFDPSWYLMQNRDVIGDPLLHYILQGEAEGRRPIAWFDPVWYAAAHGLGQARSPLAHYLANRHKPGIRALPEFDARYYLTTYPDVQRAGMDPVEHYMIQGHLENRRPFEGFDPAFYRARYMRHLPQDNPLLHFIANQHLPGVYPSLPDSVPSIPREMRRRSKPGPFFEEHSPLPASAVRRARVLAYYLPQFHATAANDRWWGKGFTEWTNVARGMPRFTDHYQPRIPRDLGHYTLDTPDVLRRQASMARDAGIEGFVFYFYWFDGQRLLDAPLEMLLAERDIAMPFCLMWANENWSRRWDGSDDELLIAQTYQPDDDEALIACFARHMQDPRYIRIDGRPLLMIYRPGTIPNTAATIERWRAGFRHGHGLDPIFVMGQAFGDLDPRQFGLDGAIEFPPHKLVDACTPISNTLDILDDDFTAQVYEYADVVQTALAAPPSPYPLIRTAAPSWDNDARRQGHGLVLHGSTPPLYENWLSGLIEQARQTPFFGEPLVCINAWNEWAEGAYLEPDQHFGSAYLNATARAVTGFQKSSTRHRLLLVGHDAFPAGAQALLLAIGRHFRQRHGVDILFILLEDGDMRAAYQAVAPVEILPAGRQETRLRLRALAEEGFRSALVNSAASAPLATDLLGAGIRFSLLIHELPTLLRQRGLADALSEFQPLAQHVIIPSTALAPIPHAPNVRVLPQGLYAPAPFSSRDRAALRQAFALRDTDKLVIGAGYADMRKGFDHFVQLWRHVCTQDAPITDTRIHFIWLGDIDPLLRTGLETDLLYATRSGTFFMPGRVADIAPYLSAADAFVLPSREDPYPSVILEALSSGLPCHAFADSGGIPELLSSLNRKARPLHSVAPMGDVTQLRHNLVENLSRHRHSATTRRRLGRKNAERLSFNAYTEELLALAAASAPRLSVVVLSYNYAHYLAARLVSIFTQKIPVLEIIVLDDASTDDSLDVARRISAEWQREITVVPAQTNSGSVFMQWQRAVEIARGDWIWIAEADDLSEPGHMARLFDAIKESPSTVMAFSDSRAINETGATVMPDYKSYYHDAAAGRLSRDGHHRGPDFVQDCLAQRNLIMNVSSAVFARTALAEAMARCADDLSALSVAGDWRLYLELLSQPGAELAYIAEPLNLHRRHNTSATHRLHHERHFTEIVRVQNLIADRFGHAATLIDKQHQYRRQLINQFGLTPSIVAAE